MHLARVRPPRPSLRAATRRLVAGAAVVAAAAAVALVGAAPATADPGFAVTGTPVVPGPAYVGQTLTVSLADMTILPAPTSASAVWYWSDGTRVASDSTSDLVYVPTVSDLGHSLYAEVRFDGPDGELYVTGTDPTGTVALPGFVAFPSLQVTGSGLVGEPLSVTEASGAWSPTPDGLTYVWYRSSDEAAVSVGSGSRFATYTPQVADVGSTIYVVVIATKAATVSNRQTSLASTTVHLASFTDVGRPTVSGSGLVGSPFTAAFDTTGVTPTPTSVTFEWFRIDGTPVPGATSATFTPSVDLVGEPLYVQATLHAASYQDYLTLGSDYTRTVSLRSFTAGAAPVVVGRNVLGGSLTAQLDDTAWTPQPSSLTYQWFLADGTAIAGATGATLLPTSALVGSSVYATVTAHASGYQPYVIATAPTGLIAAPGLAASTPAAVVGDTVTVELWGLLLDTEYTLELHSTPVQLRTVRSSADGVIRTTVTLPAGTPAGAHRIVALLDGVEVASVAITVSAVAPAAANLPAAAAAAAAAADQLAATGADDAQRLLALAALLVAVGAAALRVSALRRSVVEVR